MLSRLDYYILKYGDKVGNFGLFYYLEMLKDSEWVGCIKLVLDEVL